MRVLNEKLGQKVVSCWSIVLCEGTFCAAVVQINTVVVLSLMLDALTSRSCILCDRAGVQPCS